MNINFKNFLVFVLPFCMLSCQKKDTTPPDPSKVSVTFNSPTDGQVIHKGDTVNFNSYVTYISELKGVGLQVIDTASSTLLFEEDYDLHTDHFSVGGSWVDTVSHNAVLLVRVYAFISNDPAVPVEHSIYIKTEN